MKPSGLAAVMQQQRGIFCYVGFCSEKTVIRCYDSTKKECKQSIMQMNCPRALHMYFCFRPRANSVCHYRHCARVCVQSGRLGSLL